MANIDRFKGDRRIDWETPDELFRELDSKYHFTLDVCAHELNHKCARYFSPEDDGLAQQWDGVCWCFPPHGREIGKWVQKAWEESTNGVLVVMLLPVRSDVSWWHEYVMRGKITFLRGRLRFKGAKWNATFASAVVVFDGSKDDGRTDVLT